MASLKEEFAEATLEAQAEMMQAMEEVLGEITAEEVMGEMAKVWVTMPDEAKERFKNERPEAYEMFMKSIQGENYGR